MTKCSVVGQKEVPSKKKSIEFCNCLQLHKFVDNTVSPIVWDNVILLCHGADFDYMYAYDNGEEQDGCIYQGHWNDGVVE